MRRVIALLSLFVLAAAGCGSNDAGNGSSDTQRLTKEAGNLVVGADIPYVPFAFGNPPLYDGMDMDLVHEIGRRLGMSVVIQKTPFDTIFRDVAQGRFDMVAASAVITDERKKVVEFSLPYFNSDQSIMVRKGSGISGEADLAGKRIGAVLGGAGEKWAKANVRSATVRTYDIVDDGFKALAAGQLDALVNDFPSSKFAERSYDTLEVVASIPTGEHYGLVFKIGSPLRQKVDNILLEMGKDGTFEKIYQKWFEVSPPDDLLRAS